MAKRSPKGIYLVSGHAHRELIPAQDSRRGSPQVLPALGH